MREQLTKASSNLNYRLALIGHPVSHSLSPPMHTAALKYLDLPGSYELLDIEPDVLDREIARIIADGYTGFNVTIPHKDAIFRMASGHTKESNQAEASNTVKILEDGSLLAHNTDIGGFEEALNELITEESKRKQAAVIGTGGAAKAALLALVNLGFRNIEIISRDPARAENLAEAMRPKFDQDVELNSCTWKDIHADQLSVIVNSSPIGQNSVPVPAWVGDWFQSLDQRVLLFDMVYSRTQNDTPLVTLAKSKGLRAADGAEMLIRQAHKAFVFWTNETPPVEVFRTAFYQSK